MVATNHGHAVYLKKRCPPLINFEVGEFEADSYNFYNKLQLSALNGFGILVIPFQCFIITSFCIEKCILTFSRWL